MTLESKRLLHIVDESICYQAAHWWSRFSFSSIWRAIRLAWIDTYHGRTELVVISAANALISNKFFTVAGLFQIEAKAVPDEFASTNNVVKRYCSQLRRAYRIIRQEHIQIYGLR